MGIFGLGTSVKKKPAPKAKAATKGKASAKSSAKGTGGNSDEAKAMLAKMQAKSDAGDCPFC